MKKRGQAAMEFIMTYGWAILVVIIAIAALAYFGVLSPSKFLPSRCTLPAGIACLDHKATASGLTLVLQNGMGFDMTGITVGVCGGTSSSPASLANGATGTYTITCSPALAAGAKFSGTISLAYTNADTGLTHSKTGDLVTKVE